MTAKKIVRFCIAIALCLLVGFIGLNYFTASMPTWYTGLVKPDITPSVSLFIPIWTIFYILMGVSLYLIFQSGSQKHDVKHGLILFGSQLLLNIVWFICFFGLHSTFLGLMMILLLWVVLLCTILQVFRFSPPATLLLVPCLGWISFVSYLNYAILVLNPGSFGLTF
jgi:tryptophan-rich sensory protein